MTDNEIRIAIAEVCKWRNCRIHKQEGLQDCARGIPPNSTSDTPYFLPEYCDDLNEIHEAVLAEIHPDAYVRRRYYQTLDKVTGDQWNSIDATAAQRAEAFLKTLNLWKE